MGVKFGFEESGLISQGVSQTHFDPSLNPTDSVIECGDTFIPLMDRGVRSSKYFVQNPELVFPPSLENDSLILIPSCETTLVQSRISIEKTPFQVYSKNQTNLYILLVLYVQR